MKNSHHRFTPFCPLSLSLSHSSLFPVAQFLLFHDDLHFLCSARNIYTRFEVVFSSHSILISSILRVYFGGFYETLKEKFLFPALTSPLFFTFCDSHKPHKLYSPKIASLIRSSISFRFICTILLFFRTSFCFPLLHRKSRKLVTFLESFIRGSKQSRIDQSKNPCPRAYNWCSD